MFNNRLRCRALSLIVLLSLGTILGGCNDTGWPDREPTVVDDIGADSLKIWPPMDFALPGDVLTVEVRGLKTVYECARVLSFSPLSVDSATVQFTTVSASVELPGTPECPLTTGLDTTFEKLAAGSGQTLVLTTPAGMRTDSVRAFSGSGVVEGFLHVPSASDTLRTFNRFTFRDSTAGHPRRALYTDSLASCEVIQSAVFDRLNFAGTPDTLSIKFRTLLATPALPDTVLPACAGVHSDTVNVVQNKYGYP